MNLKTWDLSGMVRMRTLDGRHVWVCFSEVGDRKIAKLFRTRKKAEEWAESVW